MEYVPANYARAQFGALLSRVEQGERIAIMRNGREVAMIVPSGGSEDTSGVSRLRAVRHRLRSEGREISLSEALAWRDAERP